MFWVKYVYVCKICEETFGGCWWSFSWFGQKVKDSVHISRRPIALQGHSVSRMV